MDLPIIVTTQEIRDEKYENVFMATSNMGVIHVMTRNSL